MILETIVLAASLFTGSTCAAIDNRQNKAVYVGASTILTTTRYADMGTLEYAQPPKPTDRAAWQALKAVEVALQNPNTRGTIPVRCVS